MRQSLVIFFTFAQFFFSLESTAQKSDVGNWIIYTGSQAINKKWNWWNELQYRNYNAVGDIQALVFRTGIGYNLSENNNNLLLGYTFGNFHIYPTGSEDQNEKRITNENRIYQQFITRQNFGRVFIQHRYRVEERFYNDLFRLRFRYFLSLNIPLNMPTMSSKAIYVSAYNEIFLNAKEPVYNQDRVYAGGGYVFSANFRIELGAMLQLLETRNRTQVQITLVNTIPFKSARGD